MMSNFERLKNLLSDKNVNFEERHDEDRTSLIVRQNIKNAGTVAVVLTFNEDQTILDVDFYGVAHIDSPLKREELLKLVNELNCTYRFPKFEVIDGGNVVVQYPFLIDESCVFYHWQCAEYNRDRCHGKIHEAAMVVIGACSTKLGNWALFYQLL